MKLPWVLISREEYELLKGAWPVSHRVTECHRWFSGWHDLDVLWDYLRGTYTRGGVSEARDEYARARGTDRYGKADSDG